MKKNRTRNDIFLNSIFAAFLGILLSGCSTTRAHLYRIHVDENPPGGSCTSALKNSRLTNQVVAVFPFIDNRTLKNDAFSTSIPLSKLIAAHLVSAGKNCGFFKQVEMAPPAAYENTHTELSPANFGSLQSLCKSTAVMWGEIDNSDFTFTDDFLITEYTLNINISGTINFISSPCGKIYSHPFKYEKKYNLHKNNPFMSSKRLYDAWGPQLTDILDTVAKWEMLLLCASFPGKNTSEDLPTADILSFPNADTLCYDKGNEEQRTLTVELCSIAGMVVGPLITVNKGRDYYSGGEAPLGGLKILPDLFIGMLGGYAVGALAGWGISEYFFGKDEVFYAAPPRLTPDVVLSMNVIHTRF